MAPSRTSTVKNKHSSKHATNGSGIRNSKTTSRSQSDGVVKPKGKNATHSKGAPPKPQKQGSKLATLKKKRRVYTEKELDIPALNMITPVGVEKPKGKKKGKVFVDDRESMMTILAMVNADKDGQIESKMMRARQMEEIREARKIEHDKKQLMMKDKLSDVKNDLRKKRKRGGDDEDETPKHVAVAGTKPLKPKKKTVSFA
ncbi:putative 60S ribosomal subunit assembly/export protein LOC1 [Sclerotinia borealis F-4128]|uniref:Putative 60S ribosomal subunit assembly/export protein LOC1 n=1 Tax=Sclerotinia borealis (strain F-4128) TaxID=1432307 RepID=W9CAS8_SCLBF|nr:putative 60S ribosomal subunit assembly/export protein LOC1 [Sclerotinia borealis F-4128]